MTPAQKRFIISKIPNIKFALIPESLKAFWIGYYNKNISK
jgi:hypothetical protein